MSYTVIWDEDVQEELQRLHDSAIDPEAVRHAVVRVGLELSQIPLTAGESRGDNRRVIFKFPLIAWYTVHERLKMVVITQIRMLKS